LVGKAHETIDKSPLTEARTATQEDVFGMHRTATLDILPSASSSTVPLRTKPPSQRSLEPSQHQKLKQNIILARKMEDQNSLEGTELAEAQYLRAMKEYTERSHIWHRLQQQCLKEICRFLERDECNAPRTSTIARSRQLCELTSGLPPQARLESLNSLANLLVRDKQYDEVKKVYHELIGLCRDLNARTLRWKFQGFLGKALYWDSNRNDEECVRLLIFDLADALGSDKRLDSWRLPASFVQATVAGESAVLLDKDLSTILTPLKTLNRTILRRGKLTFAMNVIPQVMDLSSACSKYHTEKQSPKHESSWDEACNALSSASRSLVKHMSDPRLQIHMETQLSSCLNFKQFGEFKWSAEALAAAFHAFELKIKVKGQDTVMLDQFRTARANIPVATIQSLDRFDADRIAALDAILAQPENVGYLPVDIMIAEPQGDEYVGGENGSDWLRPNRYGMTRSEGTSSWLSEVGIDNGPGWESSNKYGTTYSENMSAAMSGISFNYAALFP
jgi:hypothetical protein